MRRLIAYLLIVQLSLQPFLYYLGRAEANSAVLAGALAPVAPVPVSAPLPSTPVAVSAPNVGTPTVGTPSAVATVQQGLSWLNQSLQNSAGMSGGVMSAEAAATHLGQAGATQAQAQTIIQNQIASGNVAPPAQPQGFWARITSFGKQTGANAQMSMNRVGQALDFKPYTEVQLTSGSTLRWNQSATNSYQVVGEQGQVLNRSAVDGSANAKAIRIQGPVDVEAFAQYQGQLAQARAKIDIASSELSGLKLKAQANQASSSDLARIKDLQSNLPKYEKAYQSLEEQTKLASSSSKSSVREFTGNAAKFALTSVGIRAGINVLSQAVSGEGVDIGKAFGFMGEPSFWTGTAGSFLGATLFTAIGNAVLPGSGAIMSVLPGFLGAAVGYEVGSGNADRTNWTQLIASTAVSAAAFALIGGPLGIGASILAGMLVNKFFDKDEGVAPPGLEEYTPDWAQFNPMPPAPAQIPVAEFVPPPAPVAQPVPAEVVNPVPKTPEMPKADPKEIVKYQEEMQVHYQRYIKAVKDRNSTLADSEYASYKEAKNKLDSLRGYYGQ